MGIKKVSQRSVKQLENILSNAASQREYNKLRNSFSEEENESLFTKEFEEGEKEMSRTLDRFWKTIEKCAKRFIKQEKKNDRYFDVAEFKEHIDADVRSSNGEVF